MGSGASTTHAKPAPLPTTLGQAHLNWAEYGEYPVVKPGAPRNLGSTAVDALPQGAQEQRRQSALASLGPASGLVPHTSLQPCAQADAKSETLVTSGEKKAAPGDAGYRTQFSQEWSNGEYKSLKKWSGQVPEYKQRSEGSLQEVARQLSSDEVTRVDRGVRAGILAGVRTYDKLGDGRLSPRTLAQAISTTLPALTQDDIAELLCDACIDSNGTIDYAAILERGLCVEAQVAVQVESRGPDNVCWHSKLSRTEHLHSKTSWARAFSRPVQQIPRKAAMEKQCSRPQADNGVVSETLQRQSPTGFRSGRLPPSLQSWEGTSHKRASSLTFHDRPSPKGGARPIRTAEGSHKPAPELELFHTAPAATKSVPLGSPASIGRLRLNADGDVCLTTVKRQPD
mmetsp:Transcript_71749/g.134185  ORF Transcript_71749/g.134185 Transcript_71749/m.134185 type:complete len:398 (+) Transcript_71749:101-1294(+)